MDDSVQNAAAKCEHMKNFIHWMYDNNLFVKDGIIYDTTGGCSKKYKSENAFWLLSVSSFTYRLISRTTLVDHVKDGDGDDSAAVHS